MTKTYSQKSAATRAAKRELSKAPEGSAFEVWEVSGGWVFRINEPEVAPADPEAEAEAPEAEQITLTAKEYRVLTTICSHEGADSAQHDLGETWTDVAEIAQATAFSKATVRGVLAQLSIKGLIYTDEEGGERGEKTLQCISEEGCAWLLANQPQEIEEAGTELPANATDEAPGAELDASDPNGAFKVLMEENDYRAPRMLCRALRAVAVEWTGTHKQFKEAAAALGLNTANASAEYYVARKAAKNKA